MDKSHRGKPNHRNERKPRGPPQEGMNNMVRLFWGNNPFIKDMSKNNELEVRFGTTGKKKHTKIDYDNVIRKLKSLGFNSENEEGSYMLRINNEFLDPGSGTFKQSNVRSEIIGFTGIQDYCKHNDINKLIKTQSSAYQTNFYSKFPYRHLNERIRLCRL